MLPAVLRPSPSVVARTRSSTYAETVSLIERVARVGPEPGAPTPWKAEISPQKPSGAFTTPLVAPRVFWGCTLL